MHLKSVKCVFCDVIKTFLEPLQKTRFFLTMVRKRLMFREIITVHTEGHTNHSVVKIQTS